MAEDPVRKYLDAKTELDKAEQQVQDMTRMIAGVGDALSSDPWSFMVSNVGVGFPPEVAMNSSAPRLNADEWLTAKQIAEKLAAMHSARHKAVNLWASLSNTDREHLTPPTGGE